KRILGEIVSSRTGKRKFKYRPFLPDLLANSRRRASEGRYDDAAARLYRALELLAQVIIEEKYGDETDSLSPDQHSMATRSTLKLTAKRRAALTDASNLLACEADDIAKAFTEANRVMDLLTVRNSAILAHRLEPVNRDDHKQFYDRVLYYARTLDT